MSNSSALTIYYPLATDHWPLAFGLPPVLSDANVDRERHGQLGGVLHDFAHDSGDLIGLSFRRLEQQLVMHREDHARPRGSDAGELFESGVDGDHRAFENVGGSALDWHVDGLPLRVPANVLVSAVDVGEVASPSKQCADVSRLACRLNGVGDVLLDVREAIEILCDDLFGFCLTYLQPVRQPEWSDPVHDSEVDLLGFPSHIAGDA